MQIEKDGAAEVVEDVAAEAAKGAAAEGAETVATEISEDVVTADVLRNRDQPVRRERLEQLEQLEQLYRLFMHNFGYAQLRRWLGNLSKFISKGKVDCNLSILMDVNGVNQFHDNSAIDFCDVLVLQKCGEVRVICVHISCQCMDFILDISHDSS